MTKKSVAVALTIPFAALTVYALTQVGYLGIFDYQRHSSAGWQVFADLVVALILVLLWMVPEAKSRGHNPWPWVAATLFLGSFGPLAYLIFRGK